MCIVSAEEYAFLLSIMHRCPDKMISKRLTKAQKKSIGEAIMQRAVKPVAVTPVTPANPPSPPSVTAEDDDAKKVE